MWNVKYAKSDGITLPNGKEIQETGIEKGQKYSRGTGG